MGRGERGTLSVSFRLWPCRQLESGTLSDKLAAVSPTRSANVAR